jgi:hypothetical protein
MEQGLLKLEELSPAQLSDYIQGLIDRDFNSLLQLLYRLDVSEEKLRDSLNAEPEANPGDIIAQLIIERIAQRDKVRGAMKMDINDIPEDERW